MNDLDDIIPKVTVLYLRCKTPFNYVTDDQLETAVVVSTSQSGMSRSSVGSKSIIETIPARLAEMEMIRARL